MSKNDERIIQLKKQIEAKKKELNVVAKFNPITNCSIELDGTRYNIHTLQKQDLIHLLVKLKTYAITFDNMGLEDKYIISYFTVDDWIKDIISKLNLIKHKDEQSKLKNMEDNLDRLLSNEKKTELEIEEIAGALGI